jgi:hypothetical protein
VQKNKQPRGFRYGSRGQVQKYHSTLAALGINYITFENVKKISKITSQKKKKKKKIQKKKHFL